MEGLTIALVSLAAVASVAVVALLAVIGKGAAERRKLVESYEASEDELQSRIASLSSEKAALESALAARADYETALARSHQDSLVAQREAHERTLAAQKEAAAEALRNQREATEKALLAQKEAHERVLRLQETQQSKSLEAMSDAFKSLSAENSAAFRSQSAASIADILRPVQEKFSEFDKTVRESQREAAAQSATLRTHIEDVLKQSRSVGDEARNLASALTGRSKVQGDFGEMLLVDVLRSAGLVEGIHYTAQGVMTDEYGHEVKSSSGKTMIPDVIVHYPDDTSVIIDSKVSLKAYHDYVLATTLEDRSKAARDHVESVRKHVDELKAKDYAAYIPPGRRKVAYNLMFVPIEGAFRLMLEESPALWQVAKDNNVLVVSQMTLVIVLNMIQMAWKQSDQEKNIAEVYKTAEELMGRLAAWLDSYSNLGNWLKKAQEAYSESTRILRDSNQSVVRKVQKLEKLGLSVRKSQAKVKTGSRLAGRASTIIPPSLLPASSQDEG